MLTTQANVKTVKDVVFKNPSVIEIFDDYFTVVANNTRTRYTFDIEYLAAFRGVSWYQERRANLLRNRITNTTSNHILFGRPRPRSLFIHLNGDEHDFRRSNLKEVDLGYCGARRRLARNNRSGYKGVYFCNRSRKYKATIGYNKKVEHLGTFSTAYEAAIAYDARLLELHGAYAISNASLGLL